VLTGVMTLGMGVLLSLWITGIIEESERRKALIAELERARAELAESHHREGVLAERERLATEIHDTLAQGFMSILMLSQAPSTPDQLERIGRTAKENLAEARSLIEALGPGYLHSGTLADACRRVVERLDAEADIQARFTLQGEPRTLPANAEIVLLRATQEALTNVRKHANASDVGVTLTYDETATSVEIRDDGQGFEPAVADGFGLRGMRGRAGQVGGSVEVNSVPDKGTTIKVVVP
jgi:signal transduction histidine kinase